MQPNSMLYLKHRLRHGSRYQQPPKQFFTSHSVSVRPTAAVDDFNLNSTEVLHIPNEEVVDPNDLKFSTASSSYFYDSRMDGLKRLEQFDALDEDELGWLIDREHGQLELSRLSKRSSVQSNPISVSRISGTFA